MNLDSVLTNMKSNSRQSFQTKTGAEFKMKYDGEKKTFEVHFRNGCKHIYSITNIERTIDLVNRGIVYLTETPITTLKKWRYSTYILYRRTFDRQKNSLTF